MANVGSMDINVSARTAAFQSDMGKVSNQVRGAFNDIKRSAADGSAGLKSSLREAKGSLALVGEEIGITIPRHLQTFIVKLPGVGAALSAAFDSVAVVALLGLLVEGARKLYEFGEAATRAYEKIRDEANKTIAAASASTRQLELGMMSPAERLKAEISDTQALLSVTASSTRQLQTQLDELLAKKKMAYSGTTAVQTNQPAYTEDSPEVKSLRAQLATKAEQQTNYNTKIASLSKELTDQQKKDLDELTRKHQSELDKRLNAEMKFGELMLKQRQQAAKVQPSISELPDRIPMATDWAEGITKSINPQLPAYAGTKEAEELYKLSTDQNEALRQAQQIYTSIRTPMQEYVDQMTILGELLAEGKIDADQFNIAEAQAHKILGDASVDWKQLGSSIGETITQAALFGRSWTDTLKAVVVELTGVILKMTLLKDLSSSSGGGGGVSGFFSSLLGGLFGGFHASGGTIEPSKFGVVGEAGPEVVYGGVSGVTVFPNIRDDAYSHGNTVVYQIDARGSEITREQFQASLERFHRQAVAEALSISADRQRRSIR